MVFQANPLPKFNQLWADSSAYLGNETSQQLDEELSGAMDLSASLIRERSMTRNMYRPLLNDVAKKWAETAENGEHPYDEMDIVDSY